MGVNTLKALVAAERAGVRAVLGARVPVILPLGRERAAAASSWCARSRPAERSSRVNTRFVKLGIGGDLEAITQGRTPVVSALPTCSVIGCVVGINQRVDGRRHDGRSGNPDAGNRAGNDWAQRIGAFRRPDACRRRTISGTAGRAGTQFFIIQSSLGRDLSLQPSGVQYWVSTPEPESFKNSSYCAEGWGACRGEVGSDSHSRSDRLICQGPVYTVKPFVYNHLRLSSTPA